MKKNILEIFTGAFVLIAAVVFTLFAYKNAEIKPHNDGYSLIAKFNNVEGINIGSDVRVAGIKVGVVSNYQLDANSYMAVIKINIDNKVKLPRDSSAQVVSDGLLGGKYLSLSPGADETMFQPGDEIKFTQSSVNFETLIGKMMFNGEKK
ncbi:MAG: outer membrane lipid asymmetry maintenance protein MlaD [Alphaproteobacteria bacterium]